MKIKSLLLGSAAAMFAVSGAQAADRVVDVVIPEPEAVEYVRVCDAYGTGYFYIPGTEVCMKIGGYIRYDIGVGDLNGVDSDNDGTVDTYKKNARWSLQHSTATETDFGTLRTYAEARFNYGNSAGWAWRDTDGVAATAPVWAFAHTAGTSISLNFAYMDLNGLRIGKDESFFTTFTGYGGSVINDTTGGGYGPFDTNLISYTWSGGAFSAGVSLEEQAGGTLINDYMPHVAFGAGYDAGIVNLRAVAGVDTVTNAWAGKVRADVDITDSISAFAMVMYSQAASAYGTWVNGGMNTWSVIGGASIGLTDAATFNTQVQWAQANGGVDEWAVAANINYQLTPTMIVRPEVQWARSNAGTNAWGFVTRFQVSY
jgi:hypothetical protein